MIEKITLFDLDHTLLSANCSYHFGAYLYRHGYFKTPTMLKLVGVYILQKLNIISLQQLHLKVFDLIFHNKNVDILKKLTESFIPEFLKKYSYHPAIERLTKAKSMGHFTAILSNSPDFLVGPIAAFLDVSIWKATVYEVNDKSQFSKIAAFVEGSDKANYLNAFIQQFNLVKISTTAYSDSILDLPFLKAAGTAVAVNPDTKLKRYAKANNWEII